MALLPLVGHLEARQRLAQAVRVGRLPQLLLLTGPSGVGKQRLALWLGQLLLCDQPGGEPCGTCGPCRQVLGLAHPDLHWFMPIPRPKAGESGKQMEEAEELIGEKLAARRENPLYGRPDGLEGHFVSTARLLHRAAGKTPAQGKRKVLIVGDAERLVPQEASPEAANALLKLFEEPPANTQLILTASTVEGMLPTIRSRAVRLRLSPLSDRDVREFLQAHLEPAPAGAALAERVARAEGAIGTALDEESGGAKALQAAHTLLEAVVGTTGNPAELALKQGTWAARGDFTDMLDALAATLMDAARASAGHPPRRPLPPVLVHRGNPGAYAAALDRVMMARFAARQNVNPQLLLAVLGDELAEVL
jgi:DNA polymerase-3 subunit delta'